MIRRWHIQEVLVGFLAMVLSVIAGVIVLLVALLRSHHDFAIQEQTRNLLAAP